MADDKQKLVVDTVGIPYLVVTGPAPVVEQLKGAVKFPVTTLELMLQVNAPHVAEVILGFGRSILDKDTTYDPSTLFKLVEEYQTIHTLGRDSESNMFIHCQIFESGDTDKKIKDRQIFDGYIIKAHPRFTSEGRRGMTFWFMCCGLVAPMMCDALDPYTVVSVDTVLATAQANLIMGDGSLEKVKLPSFINNFGLGPQYAIGTASFTLQERLSNALYYIKTLSASKTMTDGTTKGGQQAGLNTVEYSAGDRYGVFDNAFGGRLGIEVGQQAGILYSYVLWERLAADYRRGIDMFASVVGQLASDDFMLSIVPRFSSGRNETLDFKLDIVPSVLTGKQPYEIKADDILTVLVSHDSTLSRKMNLDAIVAVFDNGIGYTHNTQSQPLSPVGVACLDPEQNERLSALSGNGLDSLISELSTQKRRIVHGPSWASAVYIDVKAINNVDRDNVAANSDAGAPVGMKDELGGNPEGTLPKLDNTKENPNALEDLKNKLNGIARALLLHRYVAGDNVIVDINPARRFNVEKPGDRLEDMLGYRVTLDLSDNSVGVPDMKFTGTLVRIIYTYKSLDGVSSATYQMTLQNVLPSSLKTSILDAEHPFYVGA